MNSKRRLTKKQLRKRKAYIRLYLQMIGFLMPVLCAIFLFVIMISKMKAYDNKKEDGVITMAESYDYTVDNFEEKTGENTRENSKADTQGDSKANTQGDSKADTREDSKDTFSGNVRNRDNSLLVLVNKLYKLPDDYHVALHELNNGEMVAECMYEDLKAMWFDGEEQNPGFSYNVCSGYRTAEKQEQLLEQEIEDNINIGMSEEEADALLTVAPSGYSEHETGLAVDIVSERNQMLDDTQELTPENQWLQEHCYEYGFILRYPKGKESVTGYSYESWHFRYVGKEAAKEIHDRGITLEEYLAE